MSISKQYAGILDDLGMENNVVDLGLLPADFIFSALYENAGKNEVFNSMRNLMVDATKLVFVIPEYNGSFPGVLKAFIDGLDRGTALTDKKCGLLGISAGDQGAGLALSHFTDILNYCGAHVLGYRLRVPYISQKMTDKEISHPVYLEKMKNHAEKLIRF